MLRRRPVCGPPRVGELVRSSWAAGIGTPGGSALLAAGGAHRQRDARTARAVRPGTGERSRTLVAAWGCCLAGGTRAARVVYCRWCFNRLLALARSPGVLRKGQTGAVASGGRRTACIADSMQFGNNEALRGWSDSRGSKDRIALIFHCLLGRFPDGKLVSEVFLIEHESESARFALEFPSGWLSGLRLHFSVVPITFASLTCSSDPGPGNSN
jgi:hypothetical protein